MKLSEFLFFVADKANYFFSGIFCKKRACRNYEHNRNIDPAKTVAFCGRFVAKQTPLKDFRFGIKNLAYGGCGIIAIHNILASKGKEKELCSLVHDLERHALVFGLFGISPYAVEKHLENEGFEVQKIFGKKNVKKADPNNENIICFYFRRNLTAHFVTGIKSSENRHLFLNSHMGACVDMSFREYTENLFDKENPIFVCLYTIKQKNTG